MGLGLRGSAEGTTATTPPTSTEPAPRANGPARSITARLLATVWSWGPSAGLSLVDQALLSGANFILNVILARWLTPLEYGAYAVAYTVFLLISGFHNSLILEPMSVLQPAQEDVPFPVYLGRTVWAHLALTLGLALSIVVGAFFVADAVLHLALWALAVSLPFVLLFWLVRRAAYVRSRPGYAALGSLVYAIVLVVGIVGIARLGRLSAFSAVVMMGVAGTAATLLAWKRLGVRVGTIVDEARRGPIGRLGQEHWHYGKWLVVATIVTFAVTQFQTFLAAAMLGLEAAGVLRALQTFTFPVAQAIVAIGYLGLPILSRDAAAGRERQLRQKGLAITGLLAGVGLVYEAGLILFGARLERLLYGGRYDDWVWLLPLLGIWPVCAAVGSGFSLILRALQKPHFFAYVSAAVIPFGLISAYLLTRFWGIGGTALSIVLSEAVAGVVTIALYQVWASPGRGDVGDARPESAVGL